MQGTGETNATGFYHDLTRRASNVAVSWINPVVSWFGDWITDNQPAHKRSEALRIGEALVNEVIQQGRILEEMTEQRHREQLAATRVVDYSWLVTEKRRLYDISDVDRLDLERMCQQVRPELYSRVVREFRSAMLREPSIADLPAIMRAIVCRVLDEQKADSSSESLSRWFSQSLTNLRSRFVETDPLMENSETLELSVNAINTMELGNLSDSDV